jgi:hypothetical protein
MQTYTLNTLLLFLKAQQYESYEAIETILGVLDDEMLLNEDKKDFILYTLRRHGLNEITHKEGRYEPSLKKDSVSIKPYKPLLEINYDWCYQVQMATVDLLSGTIHFEIPLN